MQGNDLSITTIGNGVLTVMVAGYTYVQFEGFRNALTEQQKKMEELERKNKLLNTRLEELTTDLGKTTKKQKQLLNKVDELDERTQANDRTKSKEKTSVRKRNKKKTPKKKQESSDSDKEQDSDVYNEFV